MGSVEVCPRFSEPGINELNFTNKENCIMRTRNKISFFALVLFALVAGLIFNTTGLADGNDLGTSPFDFTDAVYSAHGIVPGNIVCESAMQVAPAILSSTTPTPIRIAETFARSKRLPVPPAAAD